MKINSKTIQLNESRFEDWKGCKDLTFIDRADGNHIIEYKGKQYSYSDLNEAFSNKKNGLKDATVNEIRYIIEKEKVVLPMMQPLNEMKYDWNHIDPMTGMPKVKNRPEDKIELMSRMPSRSCYIIMLQNRVNLQSVGNMRYKARVWFDRTDSTVSSDKSKEDAVHFRAYRLPVGSIPQGWLTDDNQRD